MIGKKIAAIVSVVYLLFLVLCSSTLFWQGKIPEYFAKLSKSVVFEEGVRKTSLTDLTIVLHDGETALLDRFPALQRADFRGSENTAEIHAWCEANPQVAVLFDIALPDGTVLNNTARDLDFSGVTAENFDAYVQTMGYFDAVEHVDLGTATGEKSLRSEQLTALLSTYPQISFTYEAELQGKLISLQEEQLDLSGLTRDEVEHAAQFIRLMGNLKQIELGTQETSALTWEDIQKLSAAGPNAAIQYSFTLYGKDLMLADELIDLSGCKIEDGGAALRDVLPCLYRCKTVDMDSCGLSNEEMASLQKEFPDVELVWRIWFGTLYSVRTDTERILASKPSVGGMIDDNEAAKLAYCTKVKYLDLGHNELITNISFVSSMPELEIFIIAMNPLVDISPLKNCPKMEYLELNTTWITDLSPLSGMSQLRHLNISNCSQLTDIEPLYSLTGLERLWIGSVTPIPEEQIQKMQAAAPGCKISTASEDPHGDSWRFYSWDINTGVYNWVPRYEELRRQLGYNYQEYSFYWLDPKCTVPAPPEYIGIYYIHEDQLLGYS